MNFKEYGTENKKAIILLHGGGFSWWNYRKAAEYLKDDFHVILPILDGHADSDRPFTSMEDNASEIIEFIDAHYNGHVLLLAGLSLGGQVVLEMLSKRKDICDFALIESAMAIPSKLTNALIGPSFSSSYSLIQKRGFARLQFDSFHLDQELFEEYYADSCKISKEDLISFMKANTSYALKEEIRDTQAEVHIYAGSKETRGILKSAELIHETVPGSSLKILPGMLHGQFSMNAPKEYAEAIRDIINGRHI